MNEPIYNYLDYKNLLKTYCEDLIQRHNYSWRQIAKEAQLCAPNFLQQVLNGKKKLNSSHIQKIAQFFNWSTPEFDFFTTLISYNESHDIHEKNRHFQKLLAFQDLKPFTKSIAINMNISLSGTTPSLENSLF